MVIVKTFVMMAIIQIALIYVFLVIQIVKNVKGVLILSAPYAFKICSITKINVSSGKNTKLLSK